MEESNIDPKKMKRLRNARFKIVGEKKHTGVKLCHWTKESVKTGEKEHCYKQKFYGIKSHRCLQMTPSLPFCNLCCQFCWRDVSLRNPEWKGEFDNPKEIIDKSLEAQKQLLYGLGGVPHSEKHLKEALDPKHVAISLDGEPTLYPKLGELIEEFHKTGMTTFLVTNGTNPERLEELSKSNQLPTQLYVSLSANSEEMFKRINNPLQEGLWQKINRTLELLSRVNTRKVIRLTLIKNMNLKEPEKYAELIKGSQTDFIECKAAMPIGFAKSQGRLKFEDMALHSEIKEFAKKLAETLNYEVVDEKEDSRVVLISKNIEFY
jgi:tRNA wybutosine-synthesizing protein 1